MREGKRKGHREVNDYEFMMQAPRRARISDYVRSRAITCEHECLRVFRSDCVRTRVFTCVYERLPAYTSVYSKIFLKVSINSWTVDVREADGVTGAGHVCVPEEKAELVSLAMACGVLK